MTPKDRAREKINAKLSEYCRHQGGHVCSCNRLSRRCRVHDFTAWLIQEAEWEEPPAEREEE